MLNNATVMIFIAFFFGVHLMGARPCMSIIISRKLSLIQMGSDPRVHCIELLILLSCLLPISYTHADDGPGGWEGPGGCMAYN